MTFEDGLVRSSIRFLATFIFMTCGVNTHAQLNAQFNAPSQNQLPLTEKQKWQRLLPFVRTATDCVADVVRRRSDVGEAFQQGRMRSLIVNALAPCAQALQNLIFQHDQLHGPGTGNAFVTGPYFTDLERAVLARTKSEIDRQVALIERRRTEERARVEAADAERQKRLLVLKETQKLLLQTGYDCTNSQLARLISSNERAEIVTEAAMTICAKEVRAAIDAINNTIQAESPAYRTSVEGDEALRSVMRKNVQASAVVLRAERNATGSAAQNEPSTRSNADDEKVRNCLTTAHSAFSKTLSEKPALIRTMMELCRPEIEENARTAFLNGSSMSLEETRNQTLKRAANYSDSIIGIRH